MQRLNQYLLINSSQPENAYGPFAGEILRAEGLMGFAQVDLAHEPLPDLQSGDTVVLSRCFLRRKQLEVLIEAVRNGVSVVVLQPQQLFVERLGFTPACRVVNPGCVRFIQEEPGSEFPLQTHLPIACYDLPKDEVCWDIIAEAVDTAWESTGYAATVRGKVGEGNMTLFFYDLAEAVARIRFGDPDLSGYVTNGQWPWPHTMDLFVDRIDERVAHLPQADLHAQCLASAIVNTTPYPLARLWYYEEASYGTVGIMQSDGDLSAREQFFELAQTVEHFGGTGTFYLMEDTHLTEADVDGLRARGHTFAPHVAAAEKGEELYFALPDALKEETGSFAERFGAVSPTLQCHWAPWPSYMSIVPVHVEHGYRLLFAYLPAPEQFWAKHICGSGRPLRFCDRDGTLHDCWQQPLVTMDDLSVVELLRDRTGEAKRRFDTAFDAALNTNHTALAILSHPVSFSTYSSPVQEHCFGRFRDADLPIYNADAWLDFTERRAKVRFEQRREEDGVVVLTVLSVDGKIPVMIPVTPSMPKNQNIEINGKRIETAELERLGGRWSCVQLDSEEYGYDIEISIRAEA
jgi:hypothetical protein